MSNTPILINQPHRDKYDGSIVVPIEMRNCHAGQFVLYRPYNDFSLPLRMMGLKTWIKNCKPITPESSEEDHES